MKRLALPLFLVFAVQADNDPRLTVHTIVREDIFAGYLQKDMARFEKGEKKLEELFNERPNQRHHVVVWQASSTLYRALLAYQDGKSADGDRYYALAQERFEAASKLAPNDGGVLAVSAASRALFADRLPADKRQGEWSKAYDAYQKMAAQQLPIVDKLPSHLQGELLAGLTMAAQRTGRQEEYEKHLDKMIAVLKDSPYLPMAKTWKERPELVAKTNLLCKNCHDDGRLEPTKARLAAAKQ